MYSEANKRIATNFISAGPRGAVAGAQGAQRKEGLDLAKGEPVN
jgi:hypothetical protein